MTAIAQRVALLGAHGVRWGKIKTGKTPEQNVKLAEQLAKKHGGVLPCCQWLERNGYSGLYACMRKHPELFVHISQESKAGKTSEQHVELAERLAKKHGGVLPCKQWLRKNGHGRMAGCMKAYPELFAHIPQESKAGKTPKQNVELAERLAKKHGGILPNSYWLQQNRHYGVVSCMRKYPEMFAHISQESKRKTPKQNVELAERLAKKHGGILPNSHWLQHNGHGLDKCMRKYPEMFAHISQESKRKTPEQNVKLAEQLAKKHGGVLPCCQWLERNGYSGLYTCILNRPELFAHIPQDNKRGKTPKQNVELAERLAKKHGGTLPCCQWLTQNGHSGLYCCTRKHPEMFVHIPRLMLRKSRRAA